ncbi:hypothetical protein Q0Z83_022180 [Actinoplanes sichuanensis]|uniref:DUF222 domain-containing protein n=1 Tax=Actinoplanes sichuanensis TaxID=512349 RepID=A0ABW4AII5_9ACTN|nr:hypothetical protein [Actinoplanes sichuanensis]BEL04027.1 hypothetical protein Q0Z83_022180 [Actinoplanes sichuanensis]
MASLDDALGRLLDGGGPPAAVTRGMLAGLREALAQVTPDAPEADEAITRLLTAAEPGTPRPAEVTAPPARAARPDRLLAEVWARAIPITAERNPGEPPTDPGRLWDEIHLLGLRISADERTDLTTRAVAAARAVGAEPGDPATVIPGPARETLIPSLRSGDRTLSTGLATDPAAPAPAGLPGDGGAETAALIRLIAPVMELVTRDRHLTHCLQVLQFRGLASLAPTGEQDRLRAQMVSRVAAVAAARAYTDDWLESLVRAHEAVVSVVHVPPAPDGSWWGGLRLQAHTLVRDGAGLVATGQVKLPPARFTAARALTDHDIPLKVPESTGMVLACVRVWSRIHDTESPGRVIYAS